MHMKISINYGLFSELLDLKILKLFKTKFIEFNLEISFQFFIEILVENKNPIMKLGSVTTLTGKYLFTFLCSVHVI